MPPSKPDWRTRYLLAQDVLLAESKVRNGTVQPRWIADSNSFWYEREDADGVEYRVVEGSTGATLWTVSQQRIADMLAAQLKGPIDPGVLLLKSLRMVLDPPTARFDAFGVSYAFDLESGALREETKSGDSTWRVSPDRRAAVFVREHNLWFRDLLSGREHALSHDGTCDHAYGSPPSSARVSRQQAGIGIAAEGIWSPDSTRFLTLQTDDRHVPELPFMNFAPPKGVRPTVSVNRTSLPGDPQVTEFKMISIEVHTGAHTEADYAPLSAVRMNDTPFASGLAWWRADSLTAYFVHIERGERAAHVIAFDVETGITRIVFSETAKTYLELSVNVYAPALVLPLPATDELIWYSERTGRGHLYLYDLANGRLKRPITSGAWQVREVQQVDAERREIFLSAGGIAADEDPYYRKPCVASLDTDKIRVLSDEPGDHIVWRQGEFALVMLDLKGGGRFDVSGLSPEGDLFVETVGTADCLPRTMLRRRSGELISVLEAAEDQGLPKEWTWPEPVRLKAADGLTDIYGLLFKPHGIAAGQSYPLIDYIYGGPQVSHTPKTVFADGGFSTAAYLEAAHLAALGCYALILDGRGTAYRERAFREASYGAAHTASNLEDHVGAIDQLVARYPAIDRDRVGICGFSGGGYMTALAALRFGETFKVAVAGGGNYDQAIFWHSWGERYHGPYNPDHYAAQAAKTYASGLTGKLLLIHGLVDSGCHPAGLFQFVQALIDANKDFDLIVLPRAAHDITGYGVRRRLDYFVRHLFHDEPPQFPPFQTAISGLIERLGANATRTRGVSE